MNASVTSWAQKDARINAVVEFANERLNAADNADFLSFLSELYKNAPPEDLINRPLDELYAAAYSLWKFCQQRNPDDFKCRVFNATLEEHGWQSSHTIVEIVTDDMPFLLDSITSNLLESGHELHMLVHPIVEHQRDAAGKMAKGGKNVLTESVMHIEITAMTDPEMIQEVKDKLVQVLTFVRAAIADWKPMLAEMDGVIENLSLGTGFGDKAMVDEAQNFLKWLQNDNFTLLGYREYDHRKNAKSVTGDTGFGILRDPDVHVLRGPDGLVAISPEIQDFMDGDQIMMITKANVKSMVHRVVHLDYVGLKKFDNKGKVIAECRFVGLFTSDSYNQRAHQVPYLDAKVNYILEKSRFTGGSHDGRALMHILETLPRDELFQIDKELLFHIAMGILHLQIRPKCRAFLRKDKFERFVSALVFVPRDMYGSALRNKVEQILCDAYNGELSSRYAQLSNDRIARWHFIIRTKPGQVPDPDPNDINEKIAMVAQRWGDHMQEVLVDRWGEEKGTKLYTRYAKSFSPAYQEYFDPRFAVTDIEKIELLPKSDNIQFNFYRIAEDPDDRIRLKIYTTGQTIALSDCLPMLENMGLRVIEEVAFDVRSDSGCNMVHDFLLEDPQGEALELSNIKGRMEETLRDVWLGVVDNDGFNKLVLRAGLKSRQVLIMRAYGKYLRQLGLSYSETYMQDTLTRYADITNCFAQLFEAGFNLTEQDEATRRAAIDGVGDQIRAHLEDVDSLDQDRMLRSYLNVIKSSLRTNFYQTDENGNHKPYLSIKIKSSDVKEAPKPRPHAEIFVYSPRIEGVHLRSGAVARGGLRWSDRREDYRTEILGLVKAQQVKNTVIVPVGAKGGFVPKNLPTTGGREAFMEEGIACYKTFISGLLDITDNLLEGNVIPPEQVVRHDGDDPYLVVAADKGTATFSDIANGLAQDYGFWMDDGFASGGSQGYDHKKMGITARGAWVSVQRHFRERGIDVQTDSITVSGIGDMSGDVFGNGLLSSPALKLVAAFDHRDIFIDPDPDPAKTFKERKRLFDLPRSSWQDYDQKLISKGGGIFSRSLKSIDLTPQMRSILALDKKQKSITPNELIRAILKAPTDLLWFGGIGTYVKASSESNAAAGDRTNDAVRINGNELNCKVIGEGGNLGCTQRGRIEFSLKGGMMNTDAVDNSAGVDCSDNEVNIKILLNSLVMDGDLTRQQRDKLLEDMTDDVAHIVLRHNYLQTQAISVSRASSIRELDSFVRFIHDLEKDANLDRELEFLPNDEELQERADHDQGLTRPELAVIVAYAKMSLYDRLLESNLLDDPYLEKYLLDAFPDRLSKKYKKAISKHQLRREIIAKELCNEIVNRGGVQALKDETGAADADIARAIIIAREVFDLEDLMERIESLDYTVPATIQILMQMDLEDFSRRQTIWFLNNTDSKTPMKKVIEQFRPGIQKLSARTFGMDGLQEESLKNKIAMYQEQHVDDDLAARIANLETMIAACDIVQVASDLAFDVEDIAGSYFLLGEKVGFDWLRNQAEMVETNDHWDRLAVSSVVSDLLDQQKQLTRQALQGREKSDGLKGAEEWVKSSKSAIERIRKLIKDFQATGQINVTKLGFAARQIRNIVVD